MPLDASLLEILACPSDDHAPLRVDSRAGAAVLVCTFCASTYPIDGDIPVLLLDEATPGPNGLGRAAGTVPDRAPDSQAPEPSPTAPGPDADGSPA